MSECRKTDCDFNEEGYCTYHPPLCVNSEYSQEEIQALRDRVAKLEEENNILKQEKNRRIMEAGTTPSEEQQEKNLRNNLAENGME